MATEKEFYPVSGWVPLALLPVGLLFGVYLLVSSLSSLSMLGGPFAILWFVVAVVMLLTCIIGVAGFVAIQPNEARVLLLFGKYVGTVRASGFFWVNPFYTKRAISLRIRNFETGATHTAEQKDATGRITQQRSRTAGRPSKVNDRDGNPIDISAVVVWKVVETAEAMFEVDDYEDFVAVQSEAAMLQRQQAHAVVATRIKIVDGAVGMVEMALERLSKDGIVELDADRRASLVSNLMVVLCGDRHTQPVINTGS